MKINEMIRELRIKKGFTQEQLASLLGVSAPAVNKWEKAASYPDITLLPALARVLDTDLNTLLSFKNEPTREEIGDFLNKLAVDAAENGAEHAFRMGMDKVREYPSCHLLVLNIAVTLKGILGMYAKEEHPAFKGEIEKLYERAAKSTDEQIRDRANSLLILKYIDRKEYEKAEELLKQLPEEAGSMMDKSQMQVRLYMKQKQWKEAANILEKKLMTKLNEIQSALLDSMIIALEEGRDTDAEEIAEISRQTAGLFGLWRFGSYSAPLQLALARQDTGRCVEILKEMIPAVLEPWELDRSPLYRHMTDKKSSENFGETILPKLLSEFLDPGNKEFGFLQRNPEFQSLMEEWKSKTIS